MGFRGRICLGRASLRKLLRSTFQALLLRKLAEASFTDGKQNEQFIWLKQIVFFGSGCLEKNMPRNLQANLFGSNKLETKTKPGKNRTLASKKALRIRTIRPHYTLFHSGPLSKTSASFTFPALLCEVGKTSRRKQLRQVALTLTAPKASQQHTDNPIQFVWQKTDLFGSDKCFPMQLFDQQK